MLLGNDTTLAALILLCACLLAWLLLPRFPIVRAHPILAICLAAVAARMLPAFVLDRGLPFDIEAHWWSGSIVLAGQDIYAAPLAHDRYPYPPLHGYISALLVFLAAHHHSTFLFLDKLLPSICGVGLSAVVWVAARRLYHDDDRALCCGLLYAISPLAMLVSGYHGQFEEIPLLGISVALLLLLGEKPAWSMTILSALAVGGAVAYKTWPLLFVPPLLMLVNSWRQRIAYLAVLSLPLALSLGLYAHAFGRTGLREALGRMVGYTGSNGFCWGYVSIVHACWVHPDGQRPNPWVLTLNSRVLLVVLGAAVVLLLLRRRPLEGLVTLPLAFYLFSPGWGPNYSVWVLPFISLLSIELAQRYTLSMLPVIGLTYVDSLYAAYQHTAFSWAVLKPLEAILGLGAWVSIVVILSQIYLAGGRISWPAWSLPLRSRVVAYEPRLSSYEEGAEETVG